MSFLRVPLLLITFTVGALAQQAGRPYRLWTGPDGELLPFRSDTEVLDFLRNANVVSEQGLSTGVTAPKKIMLEKNGVRANAIFRHVDKEDSSTSISSLEVHFRDSYLFEPAAYELAVLLGLDNVPPAVLRSVHGTRGSLQMWVENALSEDKRVKQRMVAPDLISWNRQINTLRIFDALIYNTDRNQGNVLLTPNDWKLWFIDHTRAFRLFHDVPDSKSLVRCDRDLFRRLQELNEADLRLHTSDMLRSNQVRAVLQRRDQIVRRLQQLIAEHGEKAVLSDRDSETGGPP